MSNRDFESRENNQNRKEKSQNNFLLGAFIGGLAGAAAAFFFTPKSGRELRNTINQQTSSLKDKTVQIRENVVNKSNKITSKTSSLTQGLVLQSTDILNKVRHNPKRSEGYEEKTEINYIPLNSPTERNVTKKIVSTPDNDDIRRKLVEAQKAFEEEEYKVKH
jgi:gas vesicle protein